MTKMYNKLVRDKIPDIIAREGRTCETEIMNDSDYKEALRDKIIEEGEEIRKAGDAELVTEIADLYEVIDALIVAYGLSKSDIERVQAERRVERGGFEGRVKLVSVG